jgi:hypothetical protein
MARTIVSSAGGERPDGSCRESCAPCCMVYVARRLCASAHLRPQVVKTRLQLQGELLAAGRAPAILYRGAHHVPRLNAPGNMRHTVTLYSGAPLRRCAQQRILATTSGRGSRGQPRRVRAASAGRLGGCGGLVAASLGETPLSRVILRVLGVLTVITAIAPEGTLGR